MVGAVLQWAVMTTAVGNSIILADRLEFEGRGVEGLGHVPERSGAEALHVGENCQQMIVFFRMASLLVHLK